MNTRKKKLQVSFNIGSKRVIRIQGVKIEKTFRLKSKRKGSQTRQMVSSRKTELQKPLSIRNGQDPMTNNKKHKSTRKAITVRQRKDIVA
jgi:hypothetical protein